MGNILSLLFKPRSFFGTAFLKYFSTTLLEIQFGYVDEYRLPLVVPKIGFIELKSGHISYFYFQMDTTEWKLNVVMGLAFTYRRKLGAMPYIFYKDNDEREAFHNHIQSIEEEFRSREPEEFEISKAKRIKEDGKGCGITPQKIGRLVREHVDWIKSR